MEGRGESSHADTHLLSDRGDTCSTSATWSYRQQDLEENDQRMNESVNDKAICRTAPVTPSLLKICQIFIVLLEKIFFEIYCS